MKSIKIWGAITFAIISIVFYIFYYLDKVRGAENTTSLKINLLIGLVMALVFVMIRVLNAMVKK